MYFHSVKISLMLKPLLETRNLKIPCLTKKYKI